MKFSNLSVFEGTFEVVTFILEHSHNFGKNEGNFLPIDAVFIGRVRTDPLLYPKFGNIVIFRSGNQHYQKFIYVLNTFKIFNHFNFDEN